MGAVTLIGACTIGAAVGALAHRYYVDRNSTKPEGDHDLTSVSALTVLPTVPPRPLEITSAFTHYRRKHPKDELIRLFRSAQHSLNIAVYSITNDEIADSIKKAKHRGVDVQIIADREMTSKNSKQKQILDRFLANDIPVKVNNQLWDGSMHLKISVVDEKVATTGSLNYTDRGSRYNEEMLTVIKDSTVASEWDRYFNRMWNDQARYVAYSPFNLVHYA